MRENDVPFRCTCNVDVLRDNCSQSYSMQLTHKGFSVIY